MDHPQTDGAYLQAKAHAVLAKKPLLHKACVDNGLDVPELDSVSHQLLLDVYYDKVFVFTNAQVRYKPLPGKISI